MTELLALDRYLHNAHVDAQCNYVTDAASDLYNCLSELPVTDFSTMTADQLRAELHTAVALRDRMWSAVENLEKVAHELFERNRPA